MGYQTERETGVVEKGLGSGGAHGHRAGWQDFSRLYANDRDCLASFLALETAEVLLGAKPANLICLTNKRRACGRNLYQLWKEHGSALLTQSGLAVKVLADRHSSLLLLLYRAEALAALLEQKASGSSWVRRGIRRGLPCRRSSPNSRPGCISRGSRTR